MKKNTFIHLHVHSLYSFVDGISAIAGLIDKAKANGMNAIALTDHGNIVGFQEFYTLCKQRDIKPILGCEVFVARISRFHKENREDISGEHLILLVKNLTGYKNLLKLVSAANVEGYYYKPRIDKALLEKHHEGLIALSGCLGGEICQKIMADDIEGAEATALWYKNLMGEDYYLEVMRHPAQTAKEKAETYDGQVKCNAEILRIAKKLGIQVAATNDVHFLNEEDAEAQDIMTCITSGRSVDDPERVRFTGQEWLKTTAEMSLLFSDIPEAIENTQEIADKVEEYNLQFKTEFPVFPLPDRYDSQTPAKQAESEFDYLKVLTFEGMSKRYGEYPLPEITGQVNTELGVIKAKSLARTFLIVQDFIQTVRQMDLLVESNGGNIAGSFVAYCLGITDIDPYKYNLSSDVFLNEKQEFLPVFEINFDEVGYTLAIEWLKSKYGTDKVAAAEPCTFSGLKRVIEDIGSRLEIPFDEVNRIIDMIPDIAITLEKAYEINPDLKLLRNRGESKISRMLKIAETLENCMVKLSGRNVIIHNLRTENYPVFQEDDHLKTYHLNKDDLNSSGIIKLKMQELVALSIIKTILDSIKYSKDIVLTREQIPLNDQATFALFSRGDTTGLFCFPQMREYLPDIQISNFEDLIALYLLYDVNCKEYIPGFFHRKSQEKDTNNIWKILETLGVTDISKVQAIIYTRILYQLAFLKVHYPQEYWDACQNTKFYAVYFPQRSDDDKYDEFNLLQPEEIRQLREETFKNL